jgi:tetratricopeptide (TPR) repeat protein
MLKTINILIIFSLVTVYCQTNSADVFFLDMGVAIEPKNGSEKSSRLIKQTVNTNNKKVVTSKTDRSIYMATSSEMFSTLDKINDQVYAIEESFKSKLAALKIENSRLRNQVVSLNQKLNSEIINLSDKNIIDSKPITEVPMPIESNPISIDIIEADLPSDRAENIIDETVGFDEAIYTSGVIAYSNENYDQCIKYFKALSLKETNKRTSGNILLWLAESYEQIGRYKQALKSLNQLSKLGLDKYSDLVLIKQGIIYRNIGMNREAQELFITLVNIYPDSQYASLAKEEINNI